MTNIGDAGNIMDFTNTKFNAKSKAKKREKANHTKSHEITYDTKTTKTLYSN